MGDNQIYVTTLGEFSISHNGKTVSDSINRAHKPWNFLAYLVINKGREIPSSEVCSLIWDEKDETSTRGSVKVLLHRVRTFLAPLGSGMSFSPISFRKGVFCWNCAARTLMDYEVFDSLVSEANDEQTSEDRRFELYQESLSMYKGDFLGTNRSTWVNTLRDRLHKTYINTVCSFAKMCHEREKYSLALSACERAMYIEKNDERLYCLLIKSLYLTGARREALQKYHETTETFYKDFGITPSDEIKLLYREITKALNIAENNIELVQSDLRETLGEKGAFFCEYEIFKDIYQLTERGCRRSGETAYLCLLTLFSDIDDSPVPPDIRHYNRCMEELRSVVQGTLRSRDVYARYSLTQYIVLLNDVTMENATLITERITRSYRRTHPAKDVRLETSISAIDVSMP